MPSLIPEKVRYLLINKYSYQRVYLKPRKGYKNTLRYWGFLFLLIYHASHNLYVMIGMDMKLVALALGSVALGYQCIYYLVAYKTIKIMLGLEFDFNYLFVETSAQLLFVFILNHINTMCYISKKNILTLFLISLGLSFTFLLLALDIKSIAANIVLVSFIMFLNKYLSYKFCG